MVRFHSGKLEAPGILSDHLHQLRRNQLEDGVHWNIAQWQSGGLISCVAVVRFHLFRFSLMETSQDMLIYFPRDAL